VFGALIGSATGIITGAIALRIIDTRLGQPFLFSVTASLAAVMLSMVLYSAFRFISNLRAIRVQPLVALRAE